MPKYPCPVCGDPNGFPIWIDVEPPAGCPQDETWHGDSRRRSINDVSECAYQRNKAWQAAEFRKLLPDAFDETGTMKKDRLADVLGAFGAAHPGKSLVV